MQETIPAYLLNMCIELLNESIVFNSKIFGTEYNNLCFISIYKKEIRGHPGL